VVLGIIIRRGYAIDLPDLQEVRQRPAWHRDHPNYAELADQEYELALVQAF
jgi:hypothetical protein